MSEVERVLKNIMLFCEAYEKTKKEMPREYKVLKKHIKEKLNEVRD